MSIVHDEYPVDMIISKFDQDISQGFLIFGGDECSWSATFLLILLSKMSNEILYFLIVVVKFPGKGSTLLPDKVSKINEYPPQELSDLECLVSQRFYSLHLLLPHH